MADEELLDELIGGLSNADYIQGPILDHGVHFYLGNERYGPPMPTHTLYPNECASNARLSSNVSTGFRCSKSANYGYSISPSACTLTSWHCVSDSIADAGC